LLTRKRSQVQTLSRPPLFSLVKALSAPSRQRSPHTAAAPRPQAAPPPNRVGPPELDATGPPSTNDHAAWSPAAGPGPWSSPRRRERPGPASVLGQAAPQPGRRPRGGPGYGQRASQARPTPRHRFPFGPMPAGDHAARGPRRHVDLLHPTGAGPPPHRATPGPARRGQPGGSAADTAGLSVRTPGCSGHLDTGRLDAGRPLDRLDGHSHGGPDEADRATTGLAGVRTSSRPATTAGRPDRARVTAPGNPRPPATAPR
jgi:hypothetical protein